MPRRKTLWDYLASARLAAWLIAGLVAFSALGFVIPQRSQLTPNQYADFEASSPALARAIESLGLDSLFASVPMLVLIVALALNITVCTIRRMMRRRGMPVATSGFRATQERALAASELPEAVLDRGRRELEAAGWRLSRSDSALLGVKGRGGFWGSVLLHAAMLVVVAGASWTALSGFAGTLVITEGQTIVDQESAYTVVTRLPRFGEPYNGAALTLEGMEFGYEGDVVVSVVASMMGATAEGRSVRQPVRINYPFLVDGKQYLLRDSGLAADVTIDDGSSSQRVVVNLATETPFGWQDEFPLSDGRTLRIRVSPIPLVDAEQMPAQSLPATDPELRMQIASPGDEATQTAIAYLGETAELDGVSVTLHSAPAWSTFLARGDQGRWVTYVGLWGCVVGMMWRFFVPERRIAFAVRTRDDQECVAVGYRVRPWIGLSVPGDDALVRRLLSSMPKERDNA